MSNDTSGPSGNAFEAGKPGTLARSLAEARIEGVRERGGLFVEAVRATRLAMAVSDPSLPGNPIVFANEAFLHLSGYRMEEVLGQQPHFMNGEDTDPEDAVRFREALAEDRDEVIETIQYRKDRSRFVASVFLSAFKGPQGQTLFQFLTWLDITARVAAENDLLTRSKIETRLRAREARLRGVLDGMGEGFGLLAPDFTILEHNREALRMDGRPREEIVGRSHWDVFPGSEKTELGRLLKKAMAERVPVSLEHLYAREEGRALWLEMRAYPTEDGALAVFWRDVTPRRNAETALRESEERHAYLLRLSDALRPLADPAAIEEVAARLLGEQIHANRVCYVEVSGSESLVRRDYVSGVRSIVGRWRNADFGEAMEQALRTGQPTSYPTSARCRACPRANCRRTGLSMSPRRSL